MAVPRLGMASGVLTIPKAFAFEAATQSQVDNLQIHVWQSVSDCNIKRNEKGCPTRQRLVRNDCWCLTKYEIRSFVR
jgi:hypothetical protein